MKADVETMTAPLVTADSRIYVGQFARRQGQYGAVTAVGRLGGAGVDAIEDAKRLFPRDGFAETHGVVQHAGLILGDWVEFESVRNTRPRSHEYKVSHLRRLPRYAVLPEMTLAGCRALLTGPGWTGDRRAGLWALRIAGDKVILTELEARRDGALCIAKGAARAVRLFDYRDDLVFHVRSSTEESDVFLDQQAHLDLALDWSDEADHVARVVQSLAGANDPRFKEIIAWLELHHEEGSGKIFGATVDHDAAEAALRSGELAERLKSDRTLMKAYLAAALDDEAVRGAVAEYAREGHGAERIRFREEFERELAAERSARLVDIDREMQEARDAARGKLEEEMAAFGEAEKLKRKALEVDLEAGHGRRVEDLERELGERRTDLEGKVSVERNLLVAIEAAVTNAKRELADVELGIEDARRRLVEAKGDVDRMIAVANRIGLPEVAAAPAVPTSILQAGVGQRLPELPTAPLDEKGRLIAQQVLLTEPGRGLLRKLIALVLAGELPVLYGSHAPDLLRFMEAVVAPGRTVSIEADPTMMSVEDLWSRPGSGVPTAIAEAAAAAGKGGSVLVVIKGFERSGARFWHPALSDILRRGGLPRGLLVCCVAGDATHDEVGALPVGTVRMEVEDVLAEGAYMAAPALLSAKVDRRTLDPGPQPVDLSAAQLLLVELGLPLGVDDAMRVARVYVEALGLSEDVQMATTVAGDLARLIAQDSA